MNQPIENIQTDVCAIDPEVMKELQYMITLHQKYGADYQADNICELVNYILTAIADGSRRPGSWERGMLMQMGLVAHCDEHHTYRQCYGDPNQSEHQS